eukprot:6184255-Pleurochrysis_carterae.AAC.1
MESTIPYANERIPVCDHLTNPVCFSVTSLHAHRSAGVCDRISDRGRILQTLNPDELPDAFETQHAISTSSATAAHPKIP